MRYFLAIVAIWFCTHAWDAHAEPRSKAVELHKRTNFSVFVLPDMGVRFTFPFVLDEQDSYVPLTIDITNPAFESHREKGRNYFVITEKQGSPNGMLGNIFMTVAGFEISIELRTTNDLTKHYSDIVFELTPEAREELIQQTIAQRTKALEQEYKKKFEDLDAIAERKAIAHVGRLATTKPAIRGIKEESRLKLPSGDSLILYVDQVVEYSPYSIYLFDLEADSGSKGLTVLDAKLFSVDAETKQLKPIEASKEVPSRLQPNENSHGSMTVLESALNPKNLMRLQVLTDKGMVEAEW